MHVDDSIGGRIDGFGRRTAPFEVIPLHPDAAGLKRSGG